MEYTRGRGGEFEFKINDEVLEIRIDLSKNKKRISKRAATFLISTSKGWVPLFDETGTRDESLNFNVNKTRNLIDEFQYEE